jgi:uncharacterized membrane protein (DUF2068 family)
MKKAEQTPRDRIIWLIAALKTFKGVLLLAVAIGLLKLVHRDVADFVVQCIKALHVDPENRYVQTVLVKASIANARQLQALSIGSFLYAGLLLIEGTGLFLQQRWAKYFSVIITASFLPLEVWELMKKFSPTKIVVLAVNIAIVLYLVVKLRQEHA